MTDEEVDILLAQFDRTNPKLQRRIVAGLVSDLVTAQEDNARLRADLVTMGDKLKICSEELGKKAEKKA